ncbi:hypothetical protein ACO0RG_001876 [Hanseniaspora osmophila]
MDGKTKPDMDNELSFDPVLFLTLPPLIRFKIYSHFACKSDKTLCDFTSPQLTPPNPSALFLSSSTEFAAQSVPHCLQQVQTQKLLQNYVERFPVVSERDSLCTLAEMEDHFPEIRGFLTNFLYMSFWLPYDCIFLDYLRLNREEDFWYLKVEEPADKVEGPTFTTDWTKWVLYKKNASRLIFAQYTMFEYLKWIQNGSYGQDNLICVCDDFFTLTGLEAGGDESGTRKRETNDRKDQSVGAQEDGSFLPWLKIINMCELSAQVPVERLDRFKYFENLRALKLQVNDFRNFQCVMQKIIECKFHLESLSLDVSSWMSESFAQQWYRSHYFNGLAVRHLEITGINRALGLYTSEEDSKFFELETFVKIQLRFNAALQSLVFRDCCDLQWFDTCTTGNETTVLQLLAVQRLSIKFYNCNIVPKNQDQLLCTPECIESNLATGSSKSAMNLHKSSIFFYN